MRFRIDSVDCDTSIVFLHSECKRFYIKAEFKEFALNNIIEFMQKGKLLHLDVDSFVVNTVRFEVTNTRPHIKHTW